MSHLSTIPLGLLQGAPRHHDDDPEIEAVLLALKAAAVLATEKADVGFYASYLADNAIGVTPQGIFNKQQILDGIRSGKAFHSSKIENSRAVALGSDAGIVTYRATLEDGASPTQVFVSTLYRHYHDGWKGVLYQQTPLPPRAG